MGNVLTNLLSTDEPSLNFLLNRLEKTAGHPGVDVRLMSNIIQTSRDKIKELGLDPRDTTGEELYYSLLTKAKLHDEHLKMHLGVGRGASVVEIVDKMIPIIKGRSLNAKGWFIKKSVAKKIIKDTPPTRVMTFLGYSSVDSMIKRENILEVMALSRILESADWLNSLNNEYANLSLIDFEDREIEIISIEEDRLKNAKNVSLKESPRFTHMKEYGVILFLVSKEDKSEGYSLLFLLLALYYINDIKLYSSFFKLQRRKADFGGLVSRAIKEDDIYDVNLSGKKLHWRVLQRFYSVDGRSRLTPDVFSAFLEPEDLHWARISDRLYEVDPELEFWKELDFVGVTSENRAPVSFNVIDVAKNYYLELDYGSRQYGRMIQSLWSELYIRYLEQPVFENMARSQIQSQSYNYDKIKFMD